MSAGQATNRARSIERVCLAVVLILAFVLRTRHIEDFYIGPDDGSYLHSAGIEGLERGFAPLRWISEDVEWIRYVAAKYTVNDHETYQHSYAHQLVARWLYRSGLGALQSLRFSSALTGTLTVFLAWWLFVCAWPARRRVGLLAAAIVAFVPFHVFYSRTGWGQIGFACFYLAYCVHLYRVLFVIEEHDRSAFRRAGVWMLVLSMLSFGWQEGVAPYILGCTIVVAAAPWIQRRSRDERGWKESVLRSRRTWTWVWSSIPVGLATIATAMLNPLAQEHWFNERGLANLDWPELKVATLRDVFSSQRVDLQIGWLVIALAVVGVIAWLREEKGLARFLIGSVVPGALILFLGFGDAFLLRAYMPVWLIVFLCAAVGTAACARWIASRAGHLSSLLFTAAVIGALVSTTWITLFCSVENPFFVQRLYAKTSEGNIDKRNVDVQILERLRTELRPGERVVAFGNKSPIVRLLDVGIPAREDYLEGPPDTWPTWVVGVRGGRLGFEAQPQRAGYEVLATDTIGLWSLYRRKP